MQYYNKYQIKLMYFALNIHFLVIQILIFINNIIISINILGYLLNRNTENVFRNFPLK